MSLISGIRIMNTNTGTANLPVEFGTVLPFIFPAYQNFQIDTPNLLDTFRTAYNGANYSLTPQKVFGKDYAEEFRQRTAGSGSKFQYTGSSQQIMRNAGQYFHKKGTYTPKRGDIAIWTRAGDPAHGHVGIVTKVEGDNVWITEGNSGNRVKTNKYSLSQLMKNSGSRPFNGFIDAHGWLGSNVALKAAQVAEAEQAKGVVESSTRGGGSNDSADIARYKRGAHNSAQWCGYFTSYCFTDGQNLNTLA